MQLALMSEDEANEHLLGKVLGTQYHAKELEAESSKIQSESRFFTKRNRNCARN
jgi:hypothetical protein